MLWQIPRQTRTSRYIPPDPFTEPSHRYLAALGVAPTAANKDLVVKNMPLKDCEIHASWASRASSVRGRQLELERGCAK